MIKVILDSVYEYEQKGRDGIIRQRGIENRHTKMQWLDNSIGCNCTENCLASICATCPVFQIVMPIQRPV